LFKNTVDLSRNIAIKKLMKIHGNKSAKAIDNLKQKKSNRNKSNK
jgi:hypothetical protein